MVQPQIISEGLHYLSGIERIHKNFYGCSMEGLRFILDGQAYECYENPEDGYRSSGELQKCHEKCRYNFPPQPVIAEWFDGEDPERSWSTKIWKFTLKDQTTNNVILEVGTKDYDDWYPIAIFHYMPENMSINNN